MITIYFTKYMKTTSLTVAIRISRKKNPDIF